MDEEDVTRVFIKILVEEKRVENVALHFVTTKGRGKGELGQVIGGGKVRREKRLVINHCLSVPLKIKCSQEGTKA